MLVPKSCECGSLWCIGNTGRGAGGGEKRGMKIPTSVFIISSRVNFTYLSLLYAVDS